MEQTKQTSPTKTAYTYPIPSHGDFSLLHPPPPLTFSLYKLSLSSHQRYRRPLPLPFPNRHPRHPPLQLDPPIPILSDNNIQGTIPIQISNLTRLITLRLDNNQISGQIPNTINSIPQLKQLNLSNNEFYGSIPENLISKFGYQSFTGNEGLCGLGPLPVCSYTRTPPASAQTVPSNPSSLPTTTQPKFMETKTQAHRGISLGAVVAIVVATSVLVLVLVSFLIAYCCSKFNRETESNFNSSKRSVSSERKVYANNGGGYDSDGTSGTDKSRLVFFERKNSKQFELEDLLKASAEMLGKGSLGTVYKAVLDGGCTVAVKRLKNANPCGRKEFEQYMVGGSWLCLLHSSLLCVCSVSSGEKMKKTTQLGLFLLVVMCAGMSLTKISLKQHSRGLHMVIPSTFLTGHSFLDECRTQSKH